MQLQVKVVPSASRDEIAGWYGEALKVRVSAPAERGRANAAVEKLLAEALGLPPAGIRIVGGVTSARKTVEISGESETAVRERLAAITATRP